jgi:hypothetical protein
MAQKCVVVGDLGESWRVLEGRFEEEQHVQKEEKGGESGEQPAHKSPPPPVHVCAPMIGHDPGFGAEPDHSAVTLADSIRPMCYPESDFVIIGFDPRNEYFEFDRVRTVFAPEIREHLPPSVPIVLASGAIWQNSEWAAKPVIVSEKRARNCAEEIGAIFVACENFGSLDGLAPALRMGRDAALDADLLPEEAAGDGGRSSQRSAGGKSGRTCAVM